MSVGAKERNCYSTAMEFGPVILATSKPELLPKIEEIAESGWLACAWKTREMLPRHVEELPLRNGLLHTTLTGVERQLELLQIFLATAAEDTRGWTARSLAAQIRKYLSYFEKSDREYLRLYDQVIQMAETHTSGHFQPSQQGKDKQPNYPFDRDYPFRLARVLELTERCFTIIDRLDQLNVNLIART